MRLGHLPVSDAEEQLSHTPAALWSPVWLKQSIAGPARPAAPRRNSRGHSEIWCLYWSTAGVTKHLPSYERISQCRHLITACQSPRCTSKSCQESCSPTTEGANEREGMGHWYPSIQDNQTLSTRHTCAARALSCDSPFATPMTCILLLLCKSSQTSRSKAQLFIG